MNQNNPETYALTARFPLDDAARFRALARALGVTPSAEATFPPSSSAPPLTFSS